MSITIEADEANVKAQIAELPQKMLDYAFEVLMKQAELIKDLAQIYVPVETGALRDSIRVERGGEGKNWRQVRVRAGGYVVNPKTGKLVDYALFQEEGTRYIYGKYFLARAVSEVQPTISEMIKINVVNQIK